MQLPIKNLETCESLMKVESMIFDLFQKEQLKNAYLVMGSSLIGKSEMLIQLAQKIVDKSVWDLDIMTLDAEYAKLGIKELRELQGNLAKSSHGNKKICIIRAVENLSVSAVNSLLKILEDTPKNVVFFLTCNNSNKLIETVISRCQVIKVSNLDQYSKDDVGIRFYNKRVLAWLFDNDEEFRDEYTAFFEGWNEFWSSGNDAVFKDFLPNVDRKMLRLFLELMSLDMHKRRSEFELNAYGQAMETCLYVRKAIDDNGNIKLGLEVLNLKLGQLCV